MKTAIVYATRSGSTAKAAERLASLIGNADLFDISKKKAAAKCDISEYQAVIIGSPIRMGQLESNIIAFVDNNKPALSGKRLGFFILNFFSEHTGEYLETLFPASLSAEKASFGAQLDISKLKGIDKLMMNMVAKQNGGLPSARIDDDAICSFAQRFVG